MNRSRVARALAAPAAFAIAFSASAATESALGTLTVKGRTVVLKAVAASEQASPDDASEKWLVILASDRPVAPADRAPARLAELARDGRLRAVRILWRVGTDTVRAVPYDERLEQSGRAGLEHPMLDLKRYADGRLEAEFRSRMVGQDWHFHANVKSAVAPGGVLEMEPDAERVERPGDDDEKVALGELGYEYTEESFTHAVADGHLEAVKLFLRIGLSPNAHADGDQNPMLLAAQLCGNPEPGKPRSEVLEALVAAGGDVKAKDENSSTPLLWAVQTGCAPSAIRALLKAGSDPNARAKGGATPLMFAELFKRTEIAAMLRKAGARPTGLK